MQGLSLVIGLAVIGSVLFSPLNAWGQIDDASITIRTDKALYPFEQPVMITGSIRQDKLVEGKEEVSISIIKPDNTEYVRESVIINDDGTFAFSIAIPGNQPDGNYRAVVSYGTLLAEATFRVTTVFVDSAPIDRQCFMQPCVYELAEGGEIYPVYYVMAGRITDITINKEKSSLTLVINTSESSRLQVALPREIIDSLNSDGQDIEFVALADGTRANSFDVMRNETLRTISIDYTARTKQIEIIGTQVIPEFSSISLFVLGVAASLIVVWRVGTFYNEGRN